jgi:hypothetical protein
MQLTLTVKSSNRVGLSRRPKNLVVYMIGSSKASLTLGFRISTALPLLRIGISYLKKAGTRKRSTSICKYCRPFSVMLVGGNGCRVILLKDWVSKIVDGKMKSEGPLLLMKSARFFLHYKPTKRLFTRVPESEASTSSESTAFFRSIHFQKTTREDFLPFLT